MHSNEQDATKVRDVLKAMKAVVFTPTVNKFGGADEWTLDISSFELEDQMQGLRGVAEQTA